MKGRIVVLCALLFSSSSVHAWVRSTVKPTDNADTPPVFWRHRDVEIRFYPSRSDGLAIPSDAFREAIERSAATWTSVDCSDISITLVDETAELHSAGFDDYTDGTNSIVWRSLDEFSQIQDMPGQVAITTTIYGVRSGELFEADMDLNGELLWSTDGLFGATDVENTVTHELGHLIGFAHTCDVNEIGCTTEEIESTMSAVAEAGETSKRDLTLDDEVGVCTVYPTGEATPDAPIISTDGCQCRASLAPKRSLSVPFALSFAAFSYMFGRRVARRKRTR